MFKQEDQLERSKLQRRLVILNSFLDTGKFTAVDESDSEYIKEMNKKNDDEVWSEIKKVRMLYYEP